jgi:hypothetical protein
MTEQTFQVHSKILDEKQRHQEHEDYNHAISGLETGRQSRFGGIHKNNQTLEKQNRKKVADDQFLMISQGYTALYQQTLNNLHEASTVVYDAIVLASSELYQAEQAIEQLTSQANTYHGKAVFTSKTGEVFTQDGEKLSNEVLLDIIYSTNTDATPSWEEYQQRVNDLNDKQRHLDGLHQHEQRLLVLHDKIITLEKEETPENVQRLEKINQEIEDIKSDVTSDYDKTQEYEVAQVQQPVITPLDLNF